MLTALKHTIENIHKSKKVGYAKISVKKLRSFSNGERALNKSTIDLLLAMSKYVDSTSRVVISLDELAWKLHMQKRTLDAALTEARVHRLLYKKDGAYYSNFHITTSGEGSKMEYIRPLDEFTSPEFLNLTLNQQRLLGYFLTSSMLGTKQTYNIVKLYKNKLKKKKFAQNGDNGLDIFPTFKEFLKALAILINNDQIEVKLKSETFSVIKLTSTNQVDVEKTLFHHFGIAEEGKKQRISNKSVNHELIEVRISKRLCNQKPLVIASEYELDQFALIHNFSTYNLDEEQRNYLIGVKNELIQFAGDTGAMIYRKVIKRYFAENAGLVLSHAMKGKAVNYLVDFYLLPEIRSILSDAALHQNIMRNAKTNFKEILTNGIILPIEDVCSLVAYYSYKGSDNHLLQLDKDLFQHAINSSTFSRDSWVHFNNMRDNAIETFNELLKPIELSETDRREFMYECAERNLLTQKDKLLVLVERIKPKVNSVLKTAKEDVMDWLFNFEPTIENQSTYSRNPVNDFKKFMSRQLHE